MADKKQGAVKVVKPGAVKRSIRAQVVNEMIADHADEFHNRMADAYHEKGFVYERPLTAEEKKAKKERAEFEKARAEFDALVEKFPGLADRAHPAVAVDVTDDDVVDVGPADFGIDPALSRM